MPPRLPAALVKKRGENAVSWSKNEELLVVVDAAVRHLRPLTAACTNKVVLEELKDATGAKLATYYGLTAGSLDTRVASVKLHCRNRTGESPPPPLPCVGLPLVM